MIEADFNSLMETLLGGNLVDVELTTTDYTAAFEMAKRVHQTKGNIGESKAFVTLDVTSGATTYTVDPSILRITQILKPGGSTFYAENPFHRATLNDLINPLIGGGSCGSDSNQFSVLNYDLTLGYLEQLEKLSVKDVRFTYNRYNQSLLIEQQPVSDETWLMEAYLTLTDDLYRDMVWIQDWTLAELKIILGTAYRKFSSLNTPAGEIALDGPELIQEGREDKERLLEDIANYVDGEIGDFGGIVIE